MKAKIIKTTDFCWHVTPTKENIIYKEFNTLEELMKFLYVSGDHLIILNKNSTLPCNIEVEDFADCDMILEIYDDYRE